jgi:hypothetical protein
LALTDPATYQALHWLLLVFQDSWPNMQAVVLNGFALPCFPFVSPESRLYRGDWLPTCSQLITTSILAVMSII